MKRTCFLLLTFGLVLIHKHAYSQDTLRGIASYYADKFDGRKTSSGEVFRQKKLTAAHKTMAFGTKVKVVNLKNKKEVIVTINDRLPQKSKRSIDLSKKAAETLDFIRSGLTEVLIIPLNN